MEWIDVEIKIIVKISKKKHPIYLHYLEWVLGNEETNKQELAKIDDQYNINL